MTTWKASLLRPWALYNGFVAGAPAVDDATVEVNAGSLRLKAGGIEESHLKATSDILMTHLKEAALVSHAVPVVQAVRSSTGLVMTATPADSVWATLIASNVHGITSNLADGGTKTATGVFQVQLPDKYIADHDVQIRVTCQLKSVTGTGVADNGSDIDLQVYEQSKSAGTVGADICATAAQTFAALDTVYTKDFTITDTGLVAGDLLNVVLVGRAIENDGGNGTLQVVVHSVELLCDEYGALA